MLFNLYSILTWKRHVRSQINKVAIVIVNIFINVLCTKIGLSEIVQLLKKHIYPHSINLNCACTLCVSNKNGHVDAWLNCPLFYYESVMWYVFCVLCYSVCSVILCALLFCVLCYSVCSVIMCALLFCVLCYYVCSVIMCALLFCVLCYV